MQWFNRRNRPDFGPVIRSNSTGTRASPLPGVVGNVLGLHERILLSRIRSFVAGRNSQVTGRRFGIRAFLQMIEDLPDHDGILDTGDDPGGAAAFAACLNLDIEDALQTLRPGHGSTRFGGHLRFHRYPGVVALTPPCWRHQLPELAVRCKHTVEARQIDARLRHQGGQPGNETERLKDHIGSTIPVQCLKLVAKDAMGSERQPLPGYRRRRRSWRIISKWRRRSWWLDSNKRAARKPGVVHLVRWASIIFALIQCVGIDLIERLMSSIIVPALSKNHGEENP